MKTKIEIDWKKRALEAEKKLREAIEREIYLVAHINSLEQSTWKNKYNDANSSA